MKVFVYGAGKLGVSLAKALKAAKCKVVLRPARDGLPRKNIEADVIVLAVRDRDMRKTAETLAASGLVPKKCVAVHVAGALDAEAIAPLRDVCQGVAQMHPMIAFASTEFSPPLRGGHVHVQGDAPARKRAEKIAKLLGMKARTFKHLDTTGYHASAGLVANGAAALAAIGAELLVKSGVPRDVAPELLGPLLASVAANVEGLGFPAALTGPVRRGDAAGVEKHLVLLRERLPSAVPLYVASAEAQLPLARAIGDAPEYAFAAIEAFLRRPLVH
jgi:predicted short-subunit dehydrogenase-like oxidoreductase (DUF2520 family)